MIWSSKIDVTIDKGELGLTETAAKLVKSVTHYCDFGPMALYETDDGERFWIEAQYMQDCQDARKLPNIPYEVITRNREIQAKLDFGNRELNRLEREKKSKLVLPPGYEDTVRPS